MSSWKSLASTASSRIKGYVAQKDPRVAAAGADKQTWREWAGEKINSRRNQPDNGIERIAVFPGWAARKYASGIGNAEEPFEIDVYIAGYASAHRPPELASRSQRAFIRLAKSFAALPKLEDDPYPPTKPTPSTEDLLKTVRLPARPEDMNEEFEVEALEKQFQKLNNDCMDMDETRPPSPTSRPATPVVLPSPMTKISEDIKRFHANLESRLLPFWSSVLPSRMVYIQLFTRPVNGTDEDQEPIMATHVSTAPDGSFQTRFTIRWEDLCQHPGALHIAFGEPQDEHEMLAIARLVSPPPTPGASPVQRPAPVTTTARIPLTNSPIRVISDIDDTVKHANVLGGARTVFHNVFVKELSELVIPGMGDWYTRMWNKGARFHYISNGPFELLPVLGDFLTVAHLPPGSMKLRSYAGRSLFSGLLSAPASRKRANVHDVLDAFPHSRFILVGDTGEQDMELYAELAHERPKQIVAVFIRLADDTPLEDPTGRSVSQMDIQPARGATGSSSYTSSSSNEYFGQPITEEPETLVNLPPTPTPTPNFFSPTPGGRTPSLSSTTSSKVSDVEKKKYELQMRVWAARMLIPQQIPFRVFKEPVECTEWEGVFREKRRQVSLMD